jgi:hypothetical protein
MIESCTTYWPDVARHAVGSSTYCASWATSDPSGGCRCLGRLKICSMTSWRTDSLSFCSAGCPTRRRASCWPASPLGREGTSRSWTLAEAIARRSNQARKRSISAPLLKSRGGAAGAAKTRAGLWAGQARARQPGRLVNSRAWPKPLAPRRSGGPLPTRHMPTADIAITHQRRAGISVDFSAGTSGIPT